MTHARSLVRTSLMLGVFLLASVGVTAAPDRPNILLVVVDDLRFDDFGAAGHPFARTPNIDRLAHEGAQFQNMFAVTPLCSPSRASIVTGLYTRHHGILDNTERGAQSHQLQTFARALHADGYRTGFIGENRARPFLLMLSHKALHPNIVQQADGTTVPIGEGGVIPAERHKTLYAGVPLPRRANYGVPPHDKPALERPVVGLPPLGPAPASAAANSRERGDRGGHAAPR
jgi:arylsulfatase A-like enzyme